MAASSKQRGAKKKKEQVSCLGQDENDAHHFQPHHHLCSLAFVQMGNPTLDSTYC